MIFVLLHQDSREINGDREERKSSKQTQTGKLGLEIEKPPKKVIFQNWYTTV